MTPQERLRVAIIGSGMAGSSAAYFVRAALGDRADIQVYERSHVVGGRVQEITIAGQQVAAGASIAHSSNRYLAGFVNRLGLQPRRHAARGVGVWNGKGFDFRTHGGGWRDRLRLLRRYGRSPLRTHALVKGFLERFVAVYDLLEQGRAFSGPRDLFDALGLYDLSRESSRDYFRRHGVGDRFREEMIDGISRGNYGQASEMHALVNLVSLAGASMGGYLFSVREGNGMVCRRLLGAAGCAVHTRTEVTEIARLPETGRYRLTTTGGAAAEFDAVIVAAPLELASLRFTGMAPLEPRMVSRPFQVTHVTFVAGRIRPEYFGLRDAGELPDTIMTRECPAIPFSSIGAWGEVPGPGAGPGAGTAAGARYGAGAAPGAAHRVYKLFSREALGDDLLDRLFAERTETRRLVWRAYPVLRPAAAWPPFVLNAGLYYVNAMESGVSTMETEIIASRNVVNLLLEDRRHAARAATA